MFPQADSNLISLTHVQVMRRQTLPWSSLITTARMALALIILVILVAQKSRRFSFFILKLKLAFDIVQVHRQLVLALMSIRQSQLGDISALPGFSVQVMGLGTLR